MSSLDKNNKNSSSKSKQTSTKSKKAQSLITSTAPSLSASQNKVAKAKRNEQANVSNLFTQALERYKKEELEDKKRKLKEISHLATIAEEYLSTFALIGYSLQNEKVVIFNVTNSKDEAALVDLLRATFIELVNNRP